MFWIHKKRKKRILLYTDSRGDNIPGHDDYDHYGVGLENFFSVDSYLCPEKWTTTLDFLKLLYSKSPNELNGYDHIILHTGIVDHSPRHQSIAKDKIYIDKKVIFDEIFSAKQMEVHLNNDFRLEYEGDRTINMYSLKMAEERLIPRLLKIKNLLWISSNKIVPGWNGNYWKPRPKNISIIEDYSKLFLKHLPNTINLMDWKHSEVKKYTFDNMHPNKEGSNYILDQLLTRLK